MQCTQTHANGNAAWELLHSHTLTPLPPPTSSMPTCNIVIRRDRDRTKSAVSCGSRSSPLPPGQRCSAPCRRLLPGRGAWRQPPQHSAAALRIAHTAQHPSFMGPPSRDPQGTGQCRCDGACRCVAQSFKAHKTCTWCGAGRTPHPPFGPPFPRPARPPPTTHTHTHTPHAHALEPLAWPVLLPRHSFTTVLLPRHSSRTVQRAA